MIFLLFRWLREAARKREGVERVANVGGDSIGGTAPSTARAGPPSPELQIWREEMLMLSDLYKAKVTDIHPVR